MIVAQCPYDAYPNCILASDPSSKLKFGCGTSC